jgi:hypothetical protein
LEKKEEEEEEKKKKKKKKKKKRECAPQKEETMATRIRGSEMRAGLLCARDRRPIARAPSSYM